MWANSTSVVIIALRVFSHIFFKSHTYVHTYMYMCVYTYKQLISARQRRRSRQLLGPSRLAPQCDACMAATTSFQLLGFFFLGRVQTVLPPPALTQSQRPHNYAPDRNYEVLPTFNSLSKEEIVIAHVPQYQWSSLLSFWGWVVLFLVPSFALLLDHVI